MFTDPIFLNTFANYQRRKKARLFRTGLFVLLFNKSELLDSATDGFRHLLSSNG